MHPNPAFAWNHRDEMLGFIRERAFCSLFIAKAGESQVIHVPVAVHGPSQLRFHVARSNRCGALQGERALLSCVGAHAYVSPDWYGVPDRVPTWDYVAVECAGPLRRLHAAELVDQLDLLSAVHEARLAPKPIWTRDKMAPGRFEAMLPSIIGYELEIEELRGTRKLGQNKPEVERSALAKGLAAAGEAEMAALVSPRDETL